MLSELIPDFDLWPLLCIPWEVLWIYKVIQYVSLHNYSIFKINLEAKPNLACNQELRHDLDLWSLAFSVPRETLWVRGRIQSMDVSSVIAVGHAGGVPDLVLNRLVTANLAGLQTFKYVSWRLILSVDTNYSLNAILQLSFNPTYFYSFIINIFVVEEYMYEKNCTCEFFAVNFFSLIIFLLIIFSFIFLWLLFGISSK